VILVHLPGQTFLQGINYLLRERKSRKESEGAIQRPPNRPSNGSGCKVALKSNRITRLPDEPAHNY
jgi:hypothetical protein